MTEPYPKDKQLARGERRYRRKVASAKGWQRIIAAKGGPCRVCGGKPSTNGHQHMTDVIHFHHLVPRSIGGDDTADNIVPLCAFDHELVTYRNSWAARTLAESLTDAEYAYIIEKLGESGMERLFGVGRS